MKISKIRLLGLSTLTAIAALTMAHWVYAIPYHVNRSWTGDGGSGSLVGTVDVALGSYMIMNGGPNPFTNVSLTLTINGSGYQLDHVDTSNVFGTGQFFIDVNASFLIFDTANGNGFNPADLFFLNEFNNSFQYIIGSDADPNFELGRDDFNEVVGSVSFPIVFGIAAVPDTGSALAILSVSLLGLGVARRLCL